MSKWQTGRAWPLRWLLAAWLVVLCCLPAAPAWGQEASLPPYIPGELIIQWQEGVVGAAEASLLAEQGAVVLEEGAGPGLALLAVPPGSEEATAQALAADPRVAYAEPNYRTQMAVIPNDIYWPYQWNMMAVNAAAAWDVATGGSGVVIAVIDTGVDPDHPDLAAKVLPGYDFVNSDYDPRDDNGHGTHAAGIAAAMTNNGIGVAGMNWGARLLPLKVLDANGNGTYYNMINSIYYAANQGARILNLSLGGPSDSPLLQGAVSYAIGLGCLIFAATGNQGASVLYPAIYPEVIAVAATDYLDQRAAYSNFGPSVDIAAPGGTASVPVFSTWRASGYAYAYGTSMATPMVSGLAGLLWSVKPGLSSAEVWALIRDSADKVGLVPYFSGRNDYLGYGRINAAAALRLADPPLLQVGPVELSFLIDDLHPVEPQRLTIGNVSDAMPLDWQAAVTGGAKYVRLVPPTAGTVAAQASQALGVTVDRSALSYGANIGRVRISSSTPEVGGSPQI
ncbi:MAG: peptidase S8, partial [Chloroflexi bacterium]|nr:peptidase S8 [Chloroflexota bacterium]